MPIALNTSSSNSVLSQDKSLKLIVYFYKNPLLVVKLFHSLLNSASELISLNVKIIFYNDSPDDIQLCWELEKCLRNKGALNLTVITNFENLGFIRSVNQGLEDAIRDGSDVLLLNSDAYIFPGTLTELSEIARLDPMIGFISPRSNNATLCTVHTNKVARGDPDLCFKEFQVLKKHFQRYSYVPTAVGFCLYIKVEILKNFGIFDSIYGHGYNEENDLIMRANSCGCTFVQN